MAGKLTKAAAVATFNAFRDYCSRNECSDGCAFNGWCGFAAPGGFTDEEIDIIAEKILEEVIDD